MATQGRSSPQGLYRRKATVKIRKNPLRHETDHNRLMFYKKVLYFRNLKNIIRFDFKRVSHQNLPIRIENGNNKEVKIFYGISQIWVQHCRVSSNIIYYNDQKLHIVITTQHVKIMKTKMTKSISSEAL